MELRSPNTLIQLRDARRRLSKSFELVIPEFDIRPGQIVGVVGLNGAGKSTFLRILAGELATDSGTLRHRFRSPTDPMGAALGGFEKPSRWMRYRSEVALVDAAPPSWPGRLMPALRLTALEAGIAVDACETHARFWLERLGLEPYERARFRQMSTGYRMRAAIALAGVRRPQVLLLDEPIGPLDVMSQRRLLEDLRAMANDERWPLPIVVSSQHLEEIESIADAVVFVEGGRVAPVDGESPGRSVPARAFELRSSLPDSDLATVLSALGEVRGGSRVRAPMVYPTAGTSGGDVLRAVLDAGATISLFRDLTGSARLRMEQPDDEEAT